jgi:hypothetical protein
MWALERLGFVSNENINYDSWCEAGDRSAIVPNRAKHRDVTIWLSPISGRAAYFEMSYGCIGASKLKIDRVYHVSQIDVAFQDAREAIEEVNSRYTTRVDNPHFDPRCEWDDLRKTWTMNGRSCKFRRVNLVDKVKFGTPVFGE